MVRETIKSARTGEIRTLLVQRGESSRVEVRDGEGRAGSKARFAPLAGAAAGGSTSAREREGESLPPPSS